VQDLYGQRLPVPVLREFGAQDILFADQDDFYAQSFGGANGPIDFGFRGVIAAHCVHRDG
jgi:hypothetical protein